MGSWAKYQTLSWILKNEGLFSTIHFHIRCLWFTFHSLIEQNICSRSLDVWFIYSWNVAVIEIIPFVLIHQLQKQTANTLVDSLGMKNKNRHQKANSMAQNLSVSSVVTTSQATVMIANGIQVVKIWLTVFVLHVLA